MIKRSPKDRFKHGSVAHPRKAPAPTQKRAVDSLAALRLIRHRSRGGLTGGLPRAGEPALIAIEWLHRAIDQETARPDERISPKVIFPLVAHIMTLKRRPFPILQNQ